MLIPGAEPAGPAAGYVHPRHHQVLAADAADEVDGALDQHPPEVCLLALAEQLRSGLDGHLGAGFDQLGELPVGQALENRQGAELLDPHQIVAR